MMSIRIQEINTIRDTVIYHTEYLDSIFGESGMELFPIIDITIDFK